MTRLLVATGNAGKLRELSALLEGIELVGLRDAGALELPEPGRDYATNAACKALEASRATGEVALADDSGLEVDSLGGGPGWRSARYGGEHGDDAANRARLLEAMVDVPDLARTARFRCVVALADAKGALGSRVLLAFGACVGSIARAPRGSAGFGYDPLVLLDGTDRTMAELDEAVKNTVSHRARAVAALGPTLRAYLGRR